jgi:phage tail-like protein
MAYHKTDTMVGAFFSVDFGKHLSGPFKSVDGLEAKVDVNKLRQSLANGKQILVHQVGNSSLGGEITLKRAMTKSNMEMWDWRKLVEDGKMVDARVNGTITLYDNGEDHKALAKWDLLACWPSQVSGPDGSTKGVEPAIETVVIVHEGLERKE